MTFVDDYPSAILYTVGIGSTTSKTHQNEAFVPLQAEIHSSLKIDAKVGAHLQIGNDIPLP